MDLGRCGYSIPTKEDSIVFASKVLATSGKRNGRILENIEEHSKVIDEKTTAAHRTRQEQRKTMSENLKLGNKNTILQGKDSR